MLQSCRHSPHARHTVSVEHGHLLTFSRSLSSCLAFGSNNDHSKWHSLHVNSNNEMVLNNNECLLYSWHCHVYHSSVKPHLLHSHCYRPPDGFRNRSSEMLSSSPQGHRKEQMHNRDSSPMGVDPTACAPATLVPQASPSLQGHLTDSGSHSAR